MDEIKSWDHPPCLFAVEKDDRPAGGKISRALQLLHAKFHSDVPAATLNFRDSPQHIKKS
jgi:hypothetical protein